MTYELSQEEKQSLIFQHLKNLEYKKYGLELSLIEEESCITPNTLRVADINAQLADVIAQQGALTAELESLA